MSYLEDVRRACIDRCPGLLMEWLPGGRIIGRNYQCGDINGGPGDSLKVTLSGRGAGLWKDWASGEPGGDLIALYARLKSIEYQAAKFELGDLFGVERPKPTSREDWDPIRPAPNSVYRCDEMGNPKPPDMQYKNHIPVAYWAYLDEEGQLLNFRCRFDPASLGKGIPLTYCRNRKTGKTEWRWRDLGRPKPLYGLLELSMNPDKVLVVEGEKCAQAGRDKLSPFGWCVVTWPAGADNVAYADWGPLRKSTARIVLWPDKDFPGTKAMAEIARIVGRACEVVTQEISWPEHHDIADLDWDGERINTWIESSVSKAVQTKSQGQRIVVELKGSDRFWHMQSVYQAIKDRDADLYYTANGVCELQTDVYGRVILNYLDPAGMRDWSAVNLDTRKYVSNESRWTEMHLNLASAVLYDAKKHLRPLYYVSHTPIVSDGHLIETPGYDAASKIYLSLPDDYCPCDSLEESNERIADVLVDWPFESASDRTHAVGFVLTCFMRHSIDGPTPLHRFEAPSPGTGKTLLCQVLSEIVTPHAEYLPAVEDNEEAKKVITSALLKMPAIISFDNVDRFEAASLKQALTTQWWSGRILGQTKMIRLPIWCAWAATVNNPELSFEMIRRSIRIRLNAKSEHPERRPPNSFRHPDILAYVRRYRSQIVAAFARLCSSEGKTNSAAPCLGGYESWIDKLYPRLYSAGYQDFLASYSQDLERASSGSENALSHFVTRWAQEHGTTEVTADVLLSIAEGIDGLPVKRNKEGRISKNSIGWLIRKNRDRVFGGYVVEPGWHGRDGIVYRLSEVTEGGKKVRKESGENGAKDPQMQF